MSARCAAKTGAANAKKEISNQLSPIWGPALLTGSTWSGKGKWDVKKIPVIDLGECTECNSCIDICPKVFRKNSDTGLLEIIDLKEYPEDEIMEAISLCPADCITWEIMD